MPRIKSRYDHSKIYRPSGTPYASAETGVLQSKDGWTTPGAMTAAAHQATLLAILEFLKEFEAMPGQFEDGTPVIEMIFQDSGRVSAVVYEVP